MSPEHRTGRRREGLRRHRGRHPQPRDHVQGAPRQRVGARGHACPHDGDRRPLTRGGFSAILASSWSVPALPSRQPGGLSRDPCRPGHAARPCAPPVASRPRRPAERHRPGTHRAAGAGPHGGPRPQQGRRVHRGRAGRPGTSRAAAAARRRHRPPGGPRARARPAQAGRPREVHRPRRPPGPQRDAVPQGAPRPPRGVAADRLHADGRPGLPAVQPPVPTAARGLDHARRRGPGAGAPPQRGARGDPPDRGHRQRADPGARRPGRGRHGHPGGQAGDLRRRSGRPSRHDPAGVAGRGDGSGRVAGRSAVRGLAASPPARRCLRRGGRGVRGRRPRGPAPRGPPVGGLQAAQRDPAPRALPAVGLLVQR